MIEPDASGNGHDGTYGGLVAPAFVAGLVSGDTAWQVGSGTFLTISDTSVAWVNPWSVEIWVRAAAATNAELFFANGPGPGLPIIQIYVGATIVNVTNQVSTPWISVVNAVPDDNRGHHVVISYNLTSVVLYVDGSLVSWTSTGTTGATTTSNQERIGVGSVATFDEFATYGAALSSGQVAAHYAAASVSFAAYTAAVLADSPTVYYHFSSSAGWYLEQIGMSA